MLDWCRGLGLGTDGEDNDGDVEAATLRRQAVAFSFGAPQGWEQFTVGGA